MSLEVYRYNPWKRVGTDVSLKNSTDKVGIGTTSPDAKLQVVGDAFFGENVTNYTKFKTDGTVRSYGTATAWQDMIADLFGKRLNSVAGSVDYDYDDNAITFQSGGDITDAADRVSGNLEINHQFKVGTNITFKPHIHWFQQVTSGAVTSFVWTLRYRLQRNNAAKTTSWTTITCSAGTADDVFDFTGEADGLYNQLSRFDDITVTCAISDTIQFQMTRTDSETGNANVYFMDLHGEVDSFGSDEEISKT